MLIRIFIFLLLAIFGFTQPVMAAKPIIADLSDYQISIDSSFTGGDLLLFGARNDPGNIVVVVRGPERNVTIRKKSRQAGMWMNTEQATFLNVPYYYALTGTAEVDRLSDSPVYDLLNLGFEKIDLTSPRPLAPHTRDEFAKAFIQSQLDRGLYRDFKEPMTFMGATLFKTLIEFPDTLPRGDYSAEIYLVDNGVLRAAQTLPIEVKKIGSDAFIYDLAHRMPLLYGILAVLIAIVVGWGISATFGRLLP